MVSVQPWCQEFASTVLGKGLRFRSWNEVVSILLCNFRLAFYAAGFLTLDLARERHLRPQRCSHRLFAF